MHVVGLGSCEVTEGNVEGEEKEESSGQSRLIEDIRVCADVESVITLTQSNHDVPRDSSR